MAVVTAAESEQRMRETLKNISYDELAAIKANAVRICDLFQTQIAKCPFDSYRTILVNELRFQQIIIEECANRGV